MGCVGDFLKINGGSHRGGSKLGTRGPIPSSAGLLWVFSNYKAKLP